MVKLFKYFFVPMVMLTILALPLAAGAQVSNPTVPGGLSGDTVTLDKVRVWINKIADFLIAVSIIIAVIFIIWGAILWIVSAGARGKSTVVNAIIAAAIILAIGLILKTLQFLVQNPSGALGS